MGDIRWDGLDHETIHKMINSGPGPAASGPMAHFYGTLSEGLAHISDELHGKLSTLKVGWQGASGDAAQAGMSPLQEWATHAEQGSNVMKVSYELQGTYVGEARAEVPEPVKVTTPAPSGWEVAAAAASAVTLNPGPAAIVAAQAADHEAQERAKDEAARKAVTAMNKYQGASELNAATLGRFDQPPAVVVSTPPPVNNPDSHSVDTSGINNSSSFSSHNTQTSSFTYTPTPTPTPTPPPGHTPVPVGTTGIPPGSTPIQHYPPPTTPAQHTPFPTPTPNPPIEQPRPGPFPPGGPGFPGEGPFGPGGRNAFGNGPGNGPGGGPGGGGLEEGGRNGLGQGGRGGTGGTGGGQGGFGQNAVDAEGRQLGRGGPGAGGNPMLQEGMGRGGAGGNMAGGRGGAGGNGMGAGGGRGQGEDDEEHETPSYLLETEDVFGDDRMVAPPVIGERPEQ